MPNFKVSYNIVTHYYDVIRARTAEEARAFLEDKAVHDMQRNNEEGSGFEVIAVEPTDEEAFDDRTDTPRYPCESSQRAHCVPKSLASASVYSLGRLGNDTIAYRM